MGKGIDRIGEMSNMVNDLIERQAAIRKLKRMATQAYIDKLNGSAETVINCCIDVIERQIPSAQPERREQDRCKNCVNKNILVAQMKYYGFHAPDMTITEFAEDLFLDCKSKLCKAGTQMSLPECEDVPDINVGKMDDDELDEAIRHCEAMAERGKGYAHFEYICQERRQLASWLRELKRMRAQGTCDDAVSRESAIKKAIV